jgi:UDP-glucose:(heptosyl)LPS alpha-1,3-glucosyltransferase
MAVKPRIAVVSPFLDKQHGTERCVVEQLNRLAPEYEIHVYSGRVADLDLGRIAWHRVPTIRGPHLLSYIWFLAANHFWRWRDRRFRKLAFDLVYSPGINCFDADVIAVHIVFAEFYRQIREELRLLRNPVRFWPRLIHRKMTYRLFVVLERLVYRRPGVPLIVVSRKMADDLARFYQRSDNLWLIYSGIYSESFRPESRARLRGSARSALGLSEGDFLALFVGNDWKKKGLLCLLEAAGRLQGPRLRIAVVGSDDRTPFEPVLRRLRLGTAVQFLPPRPDIEFYYAAADACVAPSLEDAFALPPAEAMACGLAVIVSRQTGVSEIVTHGDDGFILENPRDSENLATLIQQLYEDAGLRSRVGFRAAKTASQFTWSSNAEQVRAVFETLLERRRRYRADEPKAAVASV